MQILTILLFSFFVFTSSGCTGARGALVFDYLEKPVAMSSSLDDPESGCRFNKDQLRVVGRLHHDVTFWGLLYSLIPLTSNVDVSKEINKQVALAGGDGVVGFTATSRGCIWSYVPILTLLPFWPSCTDVSFYGKIVKKIEVKQVTDTHLSESQDHSSVVTQPVTKKMKSPKSPVLGKKRCGLRKDLMLPDLPADVTGHHKFYVSCNSHDGDVICRAEWHFELENPGKSSYKLQPPNGWFKRSFVPNLNNGITVILSGDLCPVARGIGHAERHMGFAPSLNDEGVIRFLAESPTQHRVSVFIRADPIWRVQAFGGAIEVESEVNLRSFVVTPIKKGLQSELPGSGVELVRVNQLRNGGLSTKAFFIGSDYTAASLGYEITYMRTIAASLSIDLGDDYTMIVPGISWQKSLATYAGLEIGVGAPIALVEQTDLAARLFLDAGFNLGFGFGVGVGVDFWAGFGKAASDVDLFYFFRLSM